MPYNDAFSVNVGYMYGMEVMVIHDFGHLYLGALYNQSKSKIADVYAGKICVTLGNP